ncbi:hypothetical protein J4771_00880 [Candidatus Kaistella beijingensis]|uniref:hypothetical protein n=1 Tax=Candidatus Kaistella beijingensis TaxID=2820270 RepID=UPI001CC42FD0|nr:hypothetical protein [Candidatus Kaistella beijingensis]UBB89937.1 hypothetical protein J4771_00880 [Candidatus Kaistella beijingensis]
MKNKILISLIFFFFIPLKIKSQYTITNDIEIMKLKGNVKYLKEYKFQPIIDTNGNVTIGNKINSGNNDVSFNENGQIIKQRILKFDDTYYGILENKYDLKNRIIEKNETGGKKVTFKYDSINLNKEEIVLQDDKIYYKIIFRFNKQNKLIEKKGIKYPSKELNEQISYGYDNNGNLVSLNSIINTIFKTKYSYNNLNKLVEEISYNKDDRPSMKIEYYYDIKDNLISKKYFYDENLYLGFISEFNENNDVIKETGYKYIDQSKEFEYEYSYEYDKNNNWIKLIKFRNKVPTEILTRQIEYY